MSRSSIFDIERRTDLLQDYVALEEDFAYTSVSSRNFSTMTISSLMDKVIKDWPHREAASSVEAYLVRKGIPGTPRNVIDALYIMELWINLLHWAPVCDLKHDDEFTSVFNNVVNLDIYIENIEFILEQCNYRVRAINKSNGAYPQYVITKRDSAVDIAIEAAPNLAETLLSYMDVRNQSNIDFKKEALREIGNHFEGIKDTFRGTQYSGIWDSLSYALNNFEIRHNNDKQIRFPKQNRIEMYDKTFKLALFLLQTSNVAEYKKEIDNYKDH